MILQEHGYHVQAYSQPRQALQAVRKAPFDIALIDIKMPDLNGLELVEKIKAEDPRVAPIVMTIERARTATHERVSRTSQQWFRPAASDATPPDAVQIAAAIDSSSSHPF